jgi:hypothetical protein
MLLYVSGPYTAYEDRTVQDNVVQARDIAAAFWKQGHAVICPHLNTHWPEFVYDGLTWEDFMKGDLQMIARCDGMVMTPDWEKSRGARIEREYAESLGMPIWVWPMMVTLHLTEQRCPEQCKAFAETLGQMYRTHLSKNADYSPANILLTGDVGLATRLWDKIARILNLQGFDLQVQKGNFSAPRANQNESIDDSFMDAAVYSVIGRLLRQNKWGH